MVNAVDRTLDLDFWAVLACGVFFTMLAAFAVYGMLMYRA